jgi:MFS family permease
MNYPPHFRRNFVAFSGDYVGFALSMTFVSATTVFPALVGRLTDSEIAVGLVSTVSNGAWLLPQLVFANMLTNKRRKRPYIILGGAIGRPLNLIYGVAFALGLYLYPSVALVLLYLVQVVFFASDSLVSVAWFDVMGKAIPETRRGRLIGSAQLVSGVLAIGVGGFIAAVLGPNGPPFPYSYSILLILSSVCLLISLGSLSLVVEPDEPVEETRPAWRDYLPRLRNTLRHDRAFTRLVAVRLLAGFDGLAMGFYILFATRELGLSLATVGLFTSAQTVGRIISSVGMGAVAERVGSHRVIQISTGIGMTAPTVSLALLLAGAEASPATAAVFAWVFVTLGITVSSAMLGYYNYVLELAPPRQRPTYIGLFNTIGGLLILLPTLGGWLLQATSYSVLFSLTAVILVAAHVLSLSLPSARRASTLLQSEPVT